MTVWRYTAIPMEGAGASRQRGELAGETPADVRAALRRIGLQVVDLRPVRRPARGDQSKQLASAQSAWHRHLRSRRRPAVGELYDSLATMLDAGIPLLEAVSAVSGGTASRSSKLRAMLLELRETLRAGASLANAMRDHPSWFSAVEIEMVRSGQHSGELASVLRVLAERNERSGELSGKLAAALAYPAIVSAVGVGVVIFLSTKTLPDLVSILDDAEISTPALTAGVMAVGQSLIKYGWVGILAVLLIIVLCMYAWVCGQRQGSLSLPWIHRVIPRVMRQGAVAELMLALAEMARTGVPIVESLRVLAPASNGFGRSVLRPMLETAADRIERGESLSASLDSPRWFDEELQRLIEIGETSGELPEVLERVGQRQRRAARRAIDRLATMLEPAVILILAVLVGLVVLSAILPLVRLQEVIG